MKLATVVRSVCATSAGVLALTTGPVAVASAAPIINVPCFGPTGGTAGLIAAINSANAGGGGTINLAPGCTYAFTSGAFSSGVGNDALPVVTTGITIQGKNATLEGNNTDFRLLEVDGPSGALALNRLNITGGNSPVGGGGIGNLLGTLTLNNTEVFGNNTSGAGGGIVSGAGPGGGQGGSLTLNTSQVLGNTAQGPGGGVANTGGTVVLNNSDVDHNTAASGGAGGLLNQSGSATLNASEVNSNTSTTGGGIASGNGNGGVKPPILSTLLIVNSDVINNSATSAFGGPAGGGIANGGIATIIGSLIDHNTGVGGLGGGIANHGTVTLQHSNVNGNSVTSDTAGDLGFGGGIANVSLTDTGASNSGVLNIEDQTSVNGNSSTGTGGGIANLVIPIPSPPFPVSTSSPGTVSLESNSQVNGNTSGQGGGVDNDAFFTISNGQVSNNTASSNGGGISNEGTLSVDQGVITANLAAINGGGIFENGGTATVTNSNIRRNVPNNCFPLGSVLNCVG